MQSRRLETRLIGRSERLAKYKRPFPQQPNNALPDIIVGPVPLHIVNNHSRNITPKRVSPGLQQLPLPQLKKTTHVYSQLLSRKRSTQLVNTTQQLDSQVKKRQKQSIGRHEKTVSNVNLKKRNESALPTEFSSQIINASINLEEKSKSKQQPSFFEARKHFNPFIHLHYRKNSKSRPEMTEDRRQFARKNRRYLQNYMEYIGQPSQQYVFATSFAQLRSLKRREAAERFDLQTGYSIENIFLLSYEALTQYQKPPKQQPVNLADIIREYCKFYFNLELKCQLETLVGWSLLNAFQHQLRKLFVSQRLAMICLYFLNEDSKLAGDSIEIDTINSTLDNVKSVFFDLHISYATMLQIVISTIDAYKEPNRINHTFHLLKGMCEVQKLTNNAATSLKQLVKDAAEPAMFEAERVLNGLIDKVQDSNHFEEKLLQAEAVLRWRYLRIPPIPYLPPISQQKTYTLVLNLEQTLVHYEQSTETLKFRPNLEMFLEAVSTVFQVVLFTDSTKEYIDRMINEVDPYAAYFTYRLYRQHIRLQGDSLLKDLTRMGRDLSKVIILDNTHNNFRNCLANGIKICSWEGERADGSLRVVLHILQALAKSQVEDVRQLIRSRKVGVSEADLEPASEPLAVPFL